jgi:hypothetical protein
MLKVASNGGSTNEMIIWLRQKKVGIEEGLDATT